MSEQHGVQQKGDWKRVIGYRWIPKNIPFFLFLGVLAVLYIANGHMADKTIRKISDTERELKQLEFEYKTAKSEVMASSREPEITRAAAPLGLKIDSVPPLRIKVEN
ncbi:MAG TPA: FtsL-like putative cell division protein [Chitinophagaceae bacterium]